MAVHTKTHKRRFQIYPLWRAFSNLCVYGERFHRLRVDGRPKRIIKFAFTSVCVYNRLRVDGDYKSIKLTSQFMGGKRASGTKHARFRETVCKILSLLLPLKTFIPNFVVFFVFSGTASSYIFKISDSETLAKREFKPAILFLFGLRIIHSLGVE